LANKCGLSFEFIIERDALWQNCNNVDRDPLKCLDVKCRNVCMTGRGETQYCVTKSSFSIKTSETEENLVLIRKMHTMFILLLFTVYMLHADNARYRTPTFYSVV
jgi:hypothetical protein